MKTLFRDILNIPDVMSVVLLSIEGKNNFKVFAEPPTDDLKLVDWSAMFQTLETIREADLFFDNCRLYLRQTSSEYLLVVMGHSVSIAMVRLHCDLLLAALKRKTNAKGLRRFFSKK